jgi:hypothetical protein
MSKNGNVFPWVSQMRLPKQKNPKKKTPKLRIQPLATPTATHSIRTTPTVRELAI